jgi:hypothetical protein
LNKNSEVITRYFEIFYENSDFLKNYKKEIDNSFLNIHNEINEKAEKASSRRAVAALIYISLIVVLLYQISPVETTE